MVTVWGNWVGFGLAHKCQNRVEVRDSEKYSSLFQL